MQWQPATRRDQPRTGRLGRRCLTAAIVVGLPCAAFVCPAGAQGRPRSADQQLRFGREMRLILDEYLQIYHALAQAGTGYLAPRAERRIKHAARRIARIARRTLRNADRGASRCRAAAPSSAPARRASQARGTPAPAPEERPDAIVDLSLAESQRWILHSAAQAAATMGRVSHLDRQRAAMGQLSRALATWATLTRPADVNVVHDSRTSHVWLQRGRALRNPYLGFGRLHSGLVVSGPDKGHAEGSSHPGEEHAPDRDRQGVPLEPE